MDYFERQQTQKKLWKNREVTLHKEIYIYRSKCPLVCGSPSVPGREENSKSEENIINGRDAYLNLHNKPYPCLLGFPGHLPDCLNFHNIFILFLTKDGIYLGGDSLGHLGELVFLISPAWDMKYTC